MRKLTNWCKENWLVLVASFLLAFIPLYPKLPLFDIVQTWVYIRLEDFFVAVSFLLFGVYLLRNKERLDTPFTAPIIVYWTVGLLSTVYALFFMRQNIPGGNLVPHLALLHFARRLEYMGVFFIGFYAVRKKPGVLPVIIWTLAATLLGVIVYGVGQKFLGFPAYLTMNEEFAKGTPLRLPPTARIPATFGGHYDLAAYLVFVIPLFAALSLGMRKIWQKLVMALLSVGGLVLLLFTASRVSFGVYLIAISFTLWWKRKPWLIIPVVIVSFMLLNSVSTASERFYKTLRFSDVVIDLSTGQPIGTLDEVENGKAVVNKKESPAEESLPKGSQFISAPPVAVAPAKTLKTIEVFTNTPLATGAGEIATVSGSFLVQKAFVYDISITTRFQAEWPNALSAFARNYLTGSGFSSLSVAVDGDYLRMLGETGLIGTIAFLGIFLTGFVLYFKRRDSLAPLEESFATGVFGGLVGLFLNAVLIDVFEASKVAFSLWIILGVAVALLVKNGWKERYGTLLFRALTHTFTSYVYLGVAVFIFYRRALTLYFAGDDFTWLRWAASSTLSDLPRYFTDASGFFYRPIPKLFYFLLYSVFWLKSGAYHIVLVGLFAAIVMLLFAILLRLRVRKIVAFIVSLVFASLAIHHENVIWISGASSLLSVGFLAASVLLLTFWKRANGIRKYGIWIGVVAASLLSVLSWEAGITTFIIVGILAWGFGGMGLIEAALLVLGAAFYMVLRTNSHAVTPSGDYSVRLSTLLVNAAGNGTAYVVAVFGGPKVAEFATAVRLVMRQQKILLTGVVGLFAVAGAGYFLSRVKAVASRGVREFTAWVVAIVIALAPFLGLGNMAERYALAASFVLFLAIGVWTEAVWKKGLSARSALVVILSVCFVWNLYELSRVTHDWEVSSRIVEETVLGIKSSYFPLQDKQAFVFVNTPIRYGRAWIFPTGLNDALWHMFKFNPYPYRIYTSDTLKNAFTVTSPLGTPDVLMFDKNGILSRAHKEVQTVTE